MTLERPKKVGSKNPANNFFNKFMKNNTRQLNELGLQPTDFEKIKNNANRIFGGDLGFTLVSKLNPLVRKTYSYEDYGVESPADQKRFLKDMISDFAEDSGIEDTNVKTIKLNAASPEFDNRGNLKANSVDTYSQRVSNSASEYKDSRGKLLPEKLKDMGVVTVANVKELVAEHPDKNKHVHMNTLVDTLIEGTGRPWTPQVVVDNVDQLEATGTKVGQYLNDFGEIAGPLGLVCASINGNAVRVLPNFFGDASVKDIKNRSTIHYHPSKGHPLVDSYIEFDGQIVRVSSKAAGQALSGGQGATFLGIYQSISEIATTAEGRDAFNKLLKKNRGAADALRKLQILANVATDDESGTKSDSFDSFVEKLNLLQELLKSTKNNKYRLGVTPGDIKILRSLWSNSGSQERMHSFKNILGSAMNSRVDQDIVSTDSRPQVAAAKNEIGDEKFSPGFFNLLRSFNNNMFGEPGTSGVENPKKPDKYNSVRGWWLRLQKSLVYAIAQQVNSDPDFSLMCTWILNHGKFIQVDTRSVVQDGALVISNITATWPSTLVDRVVLLPQSAGAGFRYKLLINSDRDWERSIQNRGADAYQDDNFGFTDTPEKMKTNRIDLARMNRHWQQLINSDDSMADIVSNDERRVSYNDPRKRQTSGDNRRTNARTEIDDLFKQAAELKIINLPKNEQQENSAVSEIVEKILANTLTSDQYAYITRFVRYSLSYLHAASKNKDEFVTEASDDEEDESDDVVDRVEVTRSKREIGADDLARAEEIQWPLYYALQLNKAIIDNDNSNYVKLVSELKQSLSKIGSNLNVNSILNKRTDNTNKDVEDYTPSTYKARDSSKKNAKPQSIRLMVDFLKKYNLIADDRGVQTDFGSVGDSTARTYRFCASILKGKYDDQISKIRNDFVELLNSGDIKNLINIETIDMVKHSPGIVNEVDDIEEATGPRGYATEDKVISSITLIYWTLVLKRYLEVNAASQDNPQFLKVVQTARSVANGVIRDRNNRNEYLSAINAIVARGYVQSGGRRATPTQQSQTQQVREPQKREMAPEDVKSVLVQIKSMIPSEDYSDYVIQMADQVRQGKSAEEIVKMMNSGQLDEAKIRRSNILRGIIV